jgi:hypothetical protein
MFRACSTFHAKHTYELIPALKEKMMTEFHQRGKFLIRAGYFKNGNKNKVQM